MKVITFSYVDAKGKRSDRQVMVMSEPTKNISAIDLEGLSDSSINEFVTSYNKLYDEFISKVTELKNKWPECAFNFRNFNIEKMENETTTYI